MSFLVVDDDIQALSTFEMFLKRNGISVVCATSVDEALEIIARQPLDGAVSDYHLREKYGDEVLRALRGKDPNAELVLMSDDVDTRTIAQEMGADWIQKPLGLSEMRRLVILLNQTPAART